MFRSNFWKLDFRVQTLLSILSNHSALCIAIYWNPVCFVILLHCDESEFTPRRSYLIIEKWSISRCSCYFAAAVQKHASLLLCLICVKSFSRCVPCEVNLLCYKVTVQKKRLFVYNRHLFSFHHIDFSYNNYDRQWTLRVWTQLGVAT